MVNLDVDAAPPVRLPLDEVSERESGAEESGYIHEFALEIESLDDEGNLGSPLRFQLPGRPRGERPVEPHPLGVGVPFRPRGHIRPALEECGRRCG